jgi:hypothetical protein
MADHWKSIANLLGAPGVDEPEVEATPVEPAPVEKAAIAPVKPKVETAQVSSVEPRSSFWSDSSESSSQEVESQPDERPQAQKFDDSPAVSDRSSGFAFEPGQPIPDEALSFKSLRSTSNRGESNADRSSSKPPAAKSFSEPPPNVATEAKREAHRIMPDRTEPVAPPPATPPASPTKRKSSWESLANMFNIKVDRSKPAVEAGPVEAPQQQAPRRGSSDELPSQPQGSQPQGSQLQGSQQPSTPTRPTQDAPRRGSAARDNSSRDSASRDNASRRKPDQHLSIFDDERPSESNPALKSMFGEPASTVSKDWGKPRIVDDLEWDEVEDSAAADKSSYPAAEPAAEDESDEEPVRRGRRRRRGRRGRGDASDSPAVAARPGATGSDKPARWGDIDEEMDAVASGDDVWAEPDSFEFSARDVLTDDDETPAADDLDAELEVDDAASDGEPDRRSSRRRRRGRGRGRDRERTDSTEPSAADSSVKRPRTAARIDDERVGGFAPDIDEEDFVSDELPDALPKRTPVEDGERGERSRRRRGRSGADDAETGRGGARLPREGRSGRDAPRAPVAAVAAEEDDFEPDSESMAAMEAEDEALGESKHRNIPTWADSIQSLVAANMENRKRGDNRGTPRGRPRGRR